LESQVLFWSNLGAKEFQRGQNKEMTKQSHEKTKTLQNKDKTKTMTDKTMT
jgi:hypothetical protein